MTEEQKRYKRIDCPEFEGHFQIHDMSNEDESMMCGEDIEYQLNSYEAQIKEIREVRDKMASFLAVSESRVKELERENMDLKREREEMEGKIEIYELHGCVKEGFQIISEDAISYLYDNYPEAYEGFYERVPGEGK